MISRENFHEHFLFALTLSRLHENYVHKVLIKKHILALLHLDLIVVL